MTMPQEAREEMARRIASAAVSYAMGNESIDYTRKTYIDPDAPAEGIGEPWLTLADAAFEILGR